ncbi:hypothetical protein GCM10011611_54630 [Aliidongia dinghuensis]|uniref:Uncharacterized protein n=1 Tax=Aliidongia dinghuensis TaxID=1867774 RepID=A0A8J2YZ27_9PROT|nr:hypothetical protein [Aliidongia dinghuensis]GGF41302.1 hypothetical protein GCM10011611_54630 [Aliidongia dinghuensis]
MADKFDRDRLVKLLGMLGSAHDGEVLNAARRIDAMVRAGGRGWNELLGPAETMPGPKRVPDRADLRKLDELLAASRVSDILKLRLAAMREALKAGRLTDQDRHLLRMLHRKAVIEGAVVTT